MYQVRREGSRIRGFGSATYSHSCEDILELVDEGDKSRVIHVDAAAPLDKCILGGAVLGHVHTHSDSSP